MNNLIIKDYSEIMQREQINLAQHVTLENFDSLISLIRLPKNEENITKCQIHKKQNTCNHHFMNGYLVLTKENTEAIIGRDCGDQYFQLNEEFSIQRNKLEHDAAIEDILLTLSKQLTNINESRISEVEKQLSNIGKNIRSLINSYPTFAKKVLEQMAKSRSSTVSISVDYCETDENHKTMHNWEREDIGNIRGTYIWSYQNNIGHIFTLTKELRTTLPRIKVDKKHGLKQLKKWSKILSYISEIDQSIERAENEYINFMTHENILMTTLTIKNRQERLQIIKNHIANGNDLDAEKTLSEYDKSIRNKFQNRNIRLAA